MESPLFYLGNPPGGLTGNPAFTFSHLLLSYPIFWWTVSCQGDSQIKCRVLDPQDDAAAFGEIYYKFCYEKWSSPHSPARVNDSLKNEAALLLMEHLLDAANSFRGEVWDLSSMALQN